MHHSDNHTTIVSGGVLYGYSRKFVFQSKCLVIIFFIFFSILNMLVSVKILIDMLNILSLK